MLHSDAVAIIKQGDEMVKLIVRRVPDKQFAAGMSPLPSYVEVQPGTDSFVEFCILSFVILKVVVYTVDNTNTTMCRYSTHAFYFRARRYLCGQERV